MAAQPLERERLVKRIGFSAMGVTSFLEFRIGIGPMSPLGPIGHMGPMGPIRPMGLIGQINRP